MMTKEGSSRITALDFSTDIKRLTADFVGREWVFSEIDHWLAEPDAPRFFIITGEPGIGKSAIAARLTQIRHLNAHHFCVARQVQTVDPLIFAHSISTQLARLDDFARHLLEQQQIHIHVQIDITQNYGQALGVQIDQLVSGGRSATEAFIHAVLRPLQAMYANGYQRQTFMLVDALDEAVQHVGPETIVDVLANLGQLPAPVRFVMTSRPEGAVLRHFRERSIPHLVLDAGCEENQADVRVYARARWTDSVELQARVEQADVSKFVEQLSEASKGNFLYVVWVLRAVADGSQATDRVGELPVGLDGIYREFLRTRRVGKDVLLWRSHYRRVLSPLVAAREPVGAEELVIFSGLSVLDVNDAMLDLQQFLDPILFEQNRYQLYHQSVRDFLTTRQLAEEFWIDQVCSHKQVAERAMHRLGSDPNILGNWYVLTNLVSHLCVGDQAESASRLMLDVRWCKAKLTGDIFGRAYIRDLEHVLDLLDVRFTEFYKGAPRISPLEKPLLGVEQSVSWLPIAFALTLMRSFVSDLSHRAPVEALAGLAYLGQVQRALDAASLLWEREHGQADWMHPQALGQYDHLMRIGRRAEAYRRIALACKRRAEETECPAQKQHFERGAAQALELVVPDILLRNLDDEAIDEMEESFWSLFDLLAHAGMGAQIESLLALLYTPRGDDEMVQHGIEALVHAGKIAQAVDLGVRLGVTRLVDKVRAAAGARTKARSETSSAFRTDKIANALWLAQRAEKLTAEDQEEKASQLVDAALEAVTQLNVGSRSYEAADAEKLAPVIKAIAAIPVEGVTDRLMAALDLVPHFEPEPVQLARVWIVAVEALHGKLEPFLIQKMLERAKELIRQTRDNDHRIAGWSRLVVGFCHIGDAAQGRRAFEHAVDDLWHNMIGDRDSEYDLRYAFELLANAAVELQDAEWLNRLVFMQAAALESYRRDTREHYFCNIATALAEGGALAVAWQLLEKLLGIEYDPTELSVDEYLDTCDWTWPTWHAIEAFIAGATQPSSQVDTHELERHHLTTATLLVLAERVSRGFPKSYLRSSDSASPYVGGVRGKNADELREELEFANQKHWTLYSHAKHLAEIAKAMATLGDLEGLELVVTSARYQVHPKWQEWATGWDAGQGEVYPTVARLFVEMGEIDRAYDLADQLLGEQSLCHMIHELVCVLEERELWLQADWVQRLSERVQDPAMREWAKRRTSHLLAQAGRAPEAWETALEACELAFNTMADQEPFLFNCLQETTSGLKNLAAGDPQGALRFVWEVLRLARRLARGGVLATTAALFPLLPALGGKWLVETTWQQCQEVDRLFQALVNEGADSRYHIPATTLGVSVARRRADELPDLNF